MNAGIDTNLNSGYYYLIVKGVGNINHSDYASLGFYSLNGQLGIALPIHQFALKGDSRNGNHLLNWTYTSDEPVKQIIVEVSLDGKNFKALVSLDPETKTFNYKPLAGINYYYRLKAITVADERSYYSNIISIRDENSNVVQLVGSDIRVYIKGSGNDNYSFRLFDAVGKMILVGRLQNGINNIPVKSIAKGVLFMQLTDGVYHWTEKLIKQ